MCTDLVANIPMKTEKNLGYLLLVIKKELSGSGTEGNTTVYIEKRGKNVYTFSHVLKPSILFFLAYSFFKRFLLIYF